MAYAGFKQAEPGRKGRLVRFEKINDPERAGFPPTSGDPQKRADTRR
jgi:hypothetical protein